MSLADTAAFAAVDRLTDAVQAAIDDGDWQLARELEESRRLSLEDLVAQAAKAGPEAENLRDYLAAAQERVQKLMGELMHHQRRVVREADMVRTGRRAAAVYESAAGAD